MYVSDPQAMGKLHNSIIISLGKFMLLGSVISWTRNVMQHRFIITYRVSSPYPGDINSSNSVCVLQC